ncbi:hypothetical protein COW46_00610 [Candidatus Gracilibacteria bacterium CG17_big_fil_post_rev_8_21_14_2_50_48_13]|nr:MAG: hypothetical protein COW46_00610 [Candidatus Gracilibacteria bacterium CG17_big_fil_post_rev_8_21_14_2_50_48_13]
MQNLTIFVVGETKDPHLAALEKDLLTRCSKYFSVERHVVAPSTFFSDAQIQRGVQEETERLLGALKNAPRPVIYLDVAGKMQSTEDFTQSLASFRDVGQGVTFVIGGAYGVDVEKLAPDRRFSLSPMTTTHELIRVFFLEQLYRAGSIMAGSKYHHA